MKKFRTAVMLLFYTAHQKRLHIFQSPSTHTGAG